MLLAAGDQGKEYLMIFENMMVEHEWRILDKYAHST